MLHVLFFPFPNPTAIASTRTVYMYLISFVGKCTFNPENMNEL